jgi:hypothetical protein
MKDFSMFPETRGTGRTTKQLLDAPPNAIYIWPTYQTGYVKQLAAHLGRTDLEFHGPSFLRRDYLARPGQAIVLDHAAWESMSTNELLRYFDAKDRYERHTGEKA